MGRLLLEIFIVFAPLSLATIGGGQTIVADIQRQVVDVHHWMTAAQFVDAFAISRMAPGPGSLLVTLMIFHAVGPPVSVTFASTFTATMLWSGGQRTLGVAVTAVTTGGVVSRTSTMVEHDALLPA